MKRIIITLLALSISIGLFASGSNEKIDRVVRTNHSKVTFETIGKLQVAPTADIIAIFEDHDDYSVEAQYLTLDADLRTFPDDVFENIDSVISEDPDDLMELITDELNSYLKEGELEYTYMILGDNMFSSSYVF